MVLKDIGYGNLINPDRVIAVTGADSAPAKRMIGAAREKNLAVDATCGKKTKSIIVMDSGHIIMCAKDPSFFGREEERNGEENG